MTLTPCWWFALAQFQPRYASTPQAERAVGLNVEAEGRNGTRRRGGQPTSVQGNGFAPQQETDEVGQPRLARPNHGRPWWRPVHPWHPSTRGCFSPLGAPISIRGHGPVAPLPKRIEPHVVCCLQREVARFFGRGATSVLR